MESRTPAPRTCRRIKMVLDPNLTERVVRRPSADNPACQELAISTTFAEAVLGAFRTLDPATTPATSISRCVIAAMPQAYRLATPREVEDVLGYWEGRGLVAFGNFEEFAAA